MNKLMDTLNGYPIEELVELLDTGNKEVTIEDGKITEYIDKDNSVCIDGFITKGFEWNRSNGKEDYYECTLAIKRNSGTYDNIPVVVCSRTVDVVTEIIGHSVSVVGTFCSIRKKDEETGKSVLYYYIFAKSFEDKGVSFYNSSKNNCHFVGMIDSYPRYKRTKDGKDVCDVRISVMQKNGKVDRIPVCVWGEKAKEMIFVKYGQYIEVSGRIQQRRFAISMTQTRSVIEIETNNFEILGE